MTSYARALRLRVYFFTLSSAAFGSDSRVMADLKRRWSLFQQSTVFRKIPSAVWIFGDHERPHIHLVAVIPSQLTVHAVRDRWNGGFSNGEKLRPDHARLATYLAAQFRSDARKTPIRQRRFGFRHPPSAGLACREPDPSRSPPGSSPIASPIPERFSATEFVSISSSRCADPGTSGERNGRRPQSEFAGPSLRQASNPEPAPRAAGERPKAVGGAALTQRGLERAVGPPPRESEQRFYRIVFTTT
jgi:hypothetical protein